MPWTKAGQDWVAPLGHLETAFVTLGNAGKDLGCEHWMIISAAQLDPSSVDDDIVSKLQDGWKSIRFQNPDIATQAHDHNEKRYQPITSVDALQAWCDATFKIVTDEPSADAVFGNLTATEPQLVCYWIPAAREIAICGPHWKPDLTGLSYLLHALLSELGNPTPMPAELNGDEAQKLIPSMDAVVGVSNYQSEEASEQANKWLKGWTDGQPSIGLTTAVSGNTTPGRNLRAELILPSNVTSYMRAATDKLGTSVAAALHASVVEEIGCSNPESSATRYISFGVFDLRNHCKPPADGPSHAGSPCQLALPLNVASRATWPELIESISPFYRSLDTRSSGMMEACMIYQKRFVEGMLNATPPPQPPPPSSEVAVASLDIIDDRYIRHQYGAVTVKHVSYNISCTINQVPFVFCYSWRGQLHLSMSYNEAFYSQDFIHSFLTKVKENLIRNLHIGRNILE